MTPQLLGTTARSTDVAARHAIGEKTVKYVCQTMFPWKQWPWRVAFKYYSMPCLPVHLEEVHLLRACWHPQIRNLLRWQKTFWPLEEGSCHFFHTGHSAISTFENPAPTLCGPWFWHVLLVPNSVEKVQSIATLETTAMNDQNAYSVGTFNLTLWTK